jgi:glutamate dehydrogenase/leucine dehydrogenase
MDYKQFFTGLKDKKIAICGIGVSNTPLILKFLNLGAQVIACDRRTREQIGDVAYDLEAAGAILKLGNGYLDDLDVDIIFYDDLVMGEKDLAIPHPDMVNRDFVLTPMMELNENFVHPLCKKRIKELKLFQDL